MSTKRNLKQVRRFLFVLSIELLIGAAILFGLIYAEGVRAGQDAETLLLKYEDAQQAAGTTSGSDSSASNSSTLSLQESVPALVTSIEGHDVIGTLQVASIELTLPILSKTDSDSLELSICYYAGDIPPNKGCMVVTGHNYASGDHFGRLDQVKVGDAVTYTATDGKIYSYRVSRIRTILPNYSSAVEEHEGEYSLNLLTCADRGNTRLIVYCTGDTTVAASNAR